MSSKEQKGGEVGIESRLESLSLIEKAMELSVSTGISFKDAVERLCVELEFEKQWIYIKGALNFEGHNITDEQAKLLAQIGNDPELLRLTDELNIITEKIDSGELEIEAGFEKSRELRRRSHELLRSREVGEQ